MTSNRRNDQHDTTEQEEMDTRQTDQGAAQPEVEFEKVDRNSARRAREDAVEQEDYDGDDTDSPFDPAMMAQVEEMMQKLQRADELETELNDLRGRYGRLMADFENYRRRTTQEVSDAENVGVAKAAEALLPVLDDLTRALEAGRTDPSRILGGVTSVRDVMLRSLERLGLTPVGAEGETFDPSLHEALSVVPGERDGVILQVYQVGFKMGPRLVRPARVIVEKKD